jgi:hypothetical protein
MDGSLGRNHKVGAQLWGEMGGPIADNLRASIKE